MEFRLAILGMVLFVTVPSFVNAGNLPDSYGNRLAAAERYLQVASMKDMMRDAITETAKNLPQKVRKSYVILMSKRVHVNVLERAALASMVNHFTVDELNALADFYGSKEGRSAMKKFGAYMADVMPVIQQEMIKSQSQIQADLERSMKK